MSPRRGFHGPSGFPPGRNKVLNRRSLLRTPYTCSGWRDSRRVGVTGGSGRTEVNDSLSFLYVLLRRSCGCGERCARGTVVGYDVSSPVLALIHPNVLVSGESLDVPPVVSFPPVSGHRRTGVRCVGPLPSRPWSPTQKRRRTEKVYDKGSLLD